MKTMGLSAMLDRVNAVLVAALLLFAPVEASASQGALSSPTTGTVSGLQLTNTYNNALDALNTLNSGATAPTNQLSGLPSLGNHWLNTTSAPYPDGIYDGAQYIKPWWVDPTNHLAIMQIGGGTASIASATTTDLCSVPQASLTITGTITITGFGSSCPAGSFKVITFGASLTLTYNATSLIIPGAANVITAAGDIALAQSLGSGNWSIVSYTPANGQALINAAVDLGTLLYSTAINPPSSKYLAAYGQAISRTTYSALLAATTITQSVTRTNGSPTLTGFTDTTQIRAGAPIEGTGIPTSTTIVSCASTTCTMSANAISSGTANASVFPHGNGDGSTTFNIAHCDGAVLYGRNNMSGTPSSRLSSTYTINSPNALGASIGVQNITLAQTNVPNYALSISISDPGHSHVASSLTALAGTAAVAVPQTSPTANVLSASGTINLNSITTNSSTTGITASANSGGSGTPFGTVSPGLTENCFMRVLP